MFILLVAYMNIMVAGASASRTKGPRTLASLRRFFSGNCW